MKNKLFILLLSVLICSCETVQDVTNTQSNKQENKKTDFSLTPWVGKPVSDLLKHQKYGIPDSQKTVGEENIVTYRQIFNASGNLIDKNVNVNIFCRRSFVYKKDSIITNVIEEGSCQNTKDYLPLEDTNK
ncbi:hypothetical protein [Silvanigrella aquatica]|uniref:Uncharacterized protein n=1 Tax=Silvanigrella aquatica TaxID=1915309 RepID=A0A1L4D3F3_9BACT|nr:hypothetical protein [Silvanigrella aquatica]APJ04717.1 hypothetical protein AXG55_12720 [Silvanigrella aquatica]